MSAEIQRLLGELKAGLQDLYGSRLRGLFLFGSHSRGDYDLESDCDVLIVLDDFLRYGGEIDRTGELASRLSLEYGVSISRVFVKEGEWLAGNSPFVANVRAEAIPA